MKKYISIIALIAFFAVCGTAQARPLYYISIATGTTIEPSGTSPMMVNGSSSVTRINVPEDVIAGTTCFLQLKAVSGLSVSQSERVSGGDNSGTTVTITKKESRIDNQNYWDKAQSVTIWDGILFSGNTLHQTQFLIEGNGFVMFEITSGITRLGTGDFIVELVKTP